NLETTRFYSQNRRGAFAGIARTVLSMAAASVLTLGATTAQAQTYPERSINWIVPFPPGGAMDAIARVVGETMSKDLGQSIVVENKPGAGGNIGAAYVAKAKPDGYTIMIVANGMAVNP